MSKILPLLFSLLTTTTFIRAQNLYGTSFFGGDNGAGTINRFIPGVNNLSQGKSFESFTSNPARTNMVLAGDGKLYGMTWGGGKNNAGVIFSFDPSTSTFRDVNDFGTANGYPVGGLVQANDGKLYGTAIGGGHSQAGLIFSFDPVSSAYAVVKEFDSTSGATPSGSLIMANDGKLYGMTTYGGDAGFPGGSDNGVLFSFDPTTSALTTVHNFDFVNGNHPFGGLLQTTDGKLYGTTLMGGNNNVGVLFSYDLSSSKYTKLFDFDFGLGTNPSGSLVQADDGKLYGVTNSMWTTDPGAMFSFDPSSSTYVKLIDFDEDKGTLPYSGLMKAKDGRLYGTTLTGGSGNDGVIFVFDPASQTYTKLKDLDDTTGNLPAGSLVQANDGKLYGTTSGAGIEGSTEDGVLFSLDPTTIAFSKLKEFGVNNDGSNISGSLIRAHDGRLYGTTTMGGSNTLGVIFSIDPVSYSYTKLKDFDYANGAQSYGHLLQAGDGKLYGMTAFGGYDAAFDENNTGVIFSFDPVTSDYKRVMKFNSYDFKTGGMPYGSLIQAGDGKFYGMTSSGGGGYRGEGAGVIFSYDPSSSVYTRLKDFANFDSDGYYADVLNGVNPYGDLLQASDGKFYGMTSSGGSNNYGVLFSYDAATSTYTKLREFDSTGGSNPYGSLIQARDGKLYGMTWGGGSSDAGVIFSFDIVHSTYTKLEDFDFTNGSHPYGNLMQASDGKLYGMTSSGGGSDYGVVFSFDPVSLQYSKLADYDGSNGATPYFGSAFIELATPIPTAVSTINDTQEFSLYPNPNRGQFSVRIKLNTANEVSFELYNLMGQIVYKSPAYQFSGEQTQQISGPQLANGVYYLHTSIGNTSFTRQVVIQR